MRTRQTDHKLLVAQSVSCPLKTARFGHSYGQDSPVTATTLPVSRSSTMRCSSFVWTTRHQRMSGISAVTSFVGHTTCKAASKWGRAPIGGMTRSDPQYPFLERVSSFATASNHRMCRWSSWNQFRAYGRRRSHRPQVFYLNFYC